MPGYSMGFSGNWLPVSRMFLAPDVADLAQAEAVLVGQGAARETVATLLADVLVAALAQAVVDLGHLDRETGVAVDQRGQGLRGKDQGEGGTGGELGNVLGAATEAAGQPVGILQPYAFDEFLQRVGQ